MTVVEFYEHVLTELNKVEAPSLLLEDFNYFANKAVQQYINEVYNRYDINQQTTDDLSVLKVSHQANISETPLTNISTQSYFPGENTGYYVTLPQNYMHMLNCIVTFSIPSSTCSGAKEIHSMARRLTSDMFPSIIRNAYLKPSYKCPYYFINNTQIEVEQNAAQKLANLTGLTELESDGEEEQNTLRIEIRCGDTSKYVPTKVYFDYIRIPNKIELDYTDLESGNTDKTLEFPEYVCYEIINRFVKLALENASDPRLETNLPINQTIAGVSNNN